jgi:preprotein translocase subunit SecG
MLVIAITVVHIIMCIVLIAIVLLQTGKGSSMGAAFGGASNTLFGAAGPASFLNKLTTIAAIVFMITSFTLAVVSSRGTQSSSVLDATQTQQEQSEEQVPNETSEESVVEEEPVVSEDEASSSEEASPEEAVVEEVQEETAPTTEGDGE